MGRKQEIRCIKELYELYSFTQIDEEENYLVFTYSRGYFDNAEIIYFDNERKGTEEAKRKYEDLGYSVKITPFTSIEALHEALFSGFFGISDIGKRLEREYCNFEKLQSKKLYNADYEYVEPSYYWNDGFRSENLVSNIMEQISMDGAQLVILEAAAGYGKTCTSYAILKSMSEVDKLDYVPIFTELSKNRKAAVFRYVLLDEIDRKFSSLSSKLVISEIQGGKVPLIIDGFDELISRSNPSMKTDNNYDDEDAQTMLDTIAELFQGDCKTKMVLTSRKSAIFTGELFKEWIEKKLPNCNVTRISIEEPTVRDWLGYEKTTFLEKQSIPFASIINPILLAFMRSLPFAEFEERCSNEEQVISYYFDSLLSREQERQALRLSVEEQYTILKRLAKYFVEFEIVSEELYFIKDIFIEIIHDKYNEYKERYLSGEEKPTEEEFATKLAGHALLNRVSPVKNQIGFINDFVLGIFVGEGIIDQELKVEDATEKFIDIACTSYASRSNEKKLELLERVLPYIRKMNYEQQLEIELKLANTIQRDYIDHYISNRTFIKDVYFDGSFKFARCIFRNCTFNECYIMTSAFDHCSFNDCRFYNVQVMRDTDQNCGLTFYGNCVGHESFANEAAYEIPVIKETSYERALLKKYWPDSSRLARRSLPEKVLLASSSVEERTSLEEALESLGRKGILRKEGHSWISVTEKIGEIREILEK